MAVAVTMVVFIFVLKHIKATQILNFIKYVLYLYKYVGIEQNSESNHTKPPNWLLIWVNFTIKIFKSEKKCTYFN